MPQWSSASLPAPFNHAVGFKQLEQAVNAPFATLPVYADNSTARTAGLAAGQVYRTSTGQLMVTF